MGTLTLLGPVRWMSTLARAYGWEQHTEDIIVRILILLFIIFSYLIALYLSRYARVSGSKPLYIGVPIILTIPAIICLFFWFDPTRMISHMGDESVGFQFTFGAYPNEDKLRSLKEDGYTAVISLLHPAVVPFEPKLLATEKKAAQSIGLTVISLPMLPWISENTESLDKIKEIIQKGTGRYYVHCYLGLDRTNIVKKLIESSGSDADTSQEIPYDPSRDIRNKSSFERGDIFTLTDDVYITPYPSDAEFIRYILPNVRLVISLMDPQISRNLKWIDKEEKISNHYQLPFELLPVTKSPYNPYKVLEYAQRVWRAPKPVVVHSFNTNSTAIDAFSLAFRTNLASIPQRIFSRELTNGKIEMIAPHIAIGPEPTESEFKGKLYRKGIRKFLYIGTPNTKQAQRNSLVIASLRLDWEVISPSDKSLIPLISKGGPWYLYGPGLNQVKEIIKTTYGPAFPKTITFDPSIFTDAH
ncbi:MAG: hypothetical protein HRT90_01070 [Candidatus Margulisbacteria bacterium]|nr:hypothetical protein [Candidatus Margulisiibacteriota bacterium]